SGMKLLPQVLVNVRFAGTHDPLQSEAVLAANEQVEKELAGKGRVLLRKSGTEPLIRVMVEGENEADVLAMANRIADAVKAAG
ncbi:phosphoglucosamine mutase, partial [Providencia rettgeri]